MSLNKRSKYLLKNITIFTISNFSTKLITFFLIPLYTWKLSTSEYGIVDLLFTISSFIYPLLTLNIVESVFRFSMDKNKEDNKIIYNGIICNIIGIVIGILIIPITNIFENYSDYSILFYLYVVSLSLSQTLLVFLKGQEKLKLFAIGNIINTTLVALFNIVFLLIFDLSINGYFLAYILANVVVIIYCFIFGKIKINLSKSNYDKNLLVNMLKYSIVLLPTSFMWWIINSSDRIMIASLIGNDANGIYAISYKLPSLLTMLATIFNQAWMFSAITEKDSDDYQKYTNNVFSKLFIILSMSAIGLLGIIKPIFSIYVAPDYYEAWKYVPFLVFGYIFMTLSTFISTSYNVHKDSKGILFSGLFGAITNIFLNFLFIPLLGVSGAALATMFSYIVVFIYRLIDTKKYIKINIDLKHVFLITLVLISCVITYLDTIMNIVWCIIALIMILICYGKDTLSIINNIRKE